MTYGITEVQQAYELWKSGKKNTPTTFAVSFSSTFDHLPLLFVGISSIQKNIGRRVFSHNVIAYLHSLLEMDGAFFFPDAFVKDLEELVYEMELRAPKEGSIFFSSQKVIHIEAKSILIPFIKKLLSYYLPRQIAVATEIQKIVSAISPAFVVTKNHEEYSPNYEHLYTKAAFVGGATACEDLFAASSYHIPLCFHSKSPAATFLDVDDPEFLQKVAMLSSEEKVFLKGSVTLDVIEEYAYLVPNLKGVMVDFRNINLDGISMNFHKGEKESVLYRYSHKGLYCGDVYFSSKEEEEKTSNLARPQLGISKENLLISHAAQVEPLIEVRKRAKNAFRSLPCKYSGAHPKERYPIALLEGPCYHKGHENFYAHK